jgi:hypothetical protein
MAASLSIAEPAILLKPARLYRPGMSGTHLYDITRGVWRLDKARAEGAALAMTVVKGKVLEVYTIVRWDPANTTAYLSGRSDQANPEYATRYEFTGHVAPAHIRNRYIGLAVGQLFGSGSVVRYVNC